MNKKRILGLSIFCIFFITLILPAFAQENLDNNDWEKGHLTGIGKDFIKINGIRYDVSPDVAITGVNGDSLGSDLNQLRLADEIMFRMFKENIIEIRILRLTS